VGLAGIHQQHDSVDDFQGPLHLAAEIAVTGGVHNVDFHALELDSGGFGQNGDAPFAFQLIRIHDPFDMRFVFPKYPALLQHGIDQGGFPVVHMGDDGDVADGLSAMSVCLHNGSG